MRRTPSRRVTSQPAAGRRGPGGRCRRSGPSSAVAGHHEAGRAEFAQPLEDRLVQGPAGAAGAAGDDQVQADVAGLGQVLEQRQQRVARPGGHQVVVVDEDEALRARSTTSGCAAARRSRPGPGGARRM